MIEKPIVFFDSGIGGLPYLVHLREQLPGEDYIYLADSKHFPYGNRDAQDLKVIITSTVKRIITHFNPKCIVIACNTASVTALDDLRQITDIPVVGVVPAVKTASQRTTNNKIGVLATKRTVEGQYLQQLIDDHSHDKEVFTIGASDIVNFVENELYNASEDDIHNFIMNSVEELIKNDVDSVVLGCTHFIHVNSEISRAFGENVEVIDSRDGVSRQILRVLDKKHQDSREGVALFYTTMEQIDSSSYRGLCSSAGLNFKGVF